MVKIVYKHTVAVGTEPAFVAAWERCRTKMLARAGGALGAALFRDENAPTAYFSVTSWRSVEDWRAYYAGGIPDPEGQLATNQILVEVKSVAPSVPL